ncbi:unnamed protein product [Linum trigynum]|uniref:RNase H type-1 domain-containing protein n=1 Tax=Linum trigynum TaxID=586398 RepID=A0AAV2DT47_9ROSI
MWMEPRRAIRGLAGAGGIIWDECGKWAADFVSKIGNASAALAELWAIFYGLHLARKVGCAYFIVESDSQLAISLINGRHDLGHPYASLQASIRRFSSGLVGLHGSCLPGREYSRGLALEAQSRLSSWYA